MREEKINSTPIVERGRCRIKCAKATLVDLPHVYRFFVELENDLEARKFYRYLPCRTPEQRIRALLFLFLRLFTNILLFTNRRYVLFIALLKKRVIGVCHIDIKLKEKKGSYGIAILKGFRGRGLGYRLSILAISHAKRLGVKKLTLTVDVDNVRGIKLYRKLGFKTTKLIKRGDYRYLTGVRVDIYTMELHLNC